MRGYKNFESDPHPGELRHKIEIGYTEKRDQRKRLSQPDGYGHLPGLGSRDGRRKPTLPQRGRHEHRGRD